MCWKNKRWIITNIIIILIFILGFVGIEAYVYYYNSNMYVCSLDNKEDEYSLTIEQTKIWNEDAHGYNYGIQYDAYIYDNTDIDIKNWKAYITIPADCKLDSYWNGEFIFKDGILDIEPDQYTNVIEAN